MQDTLNKSSDKKPSAADGPFLKKGQQIKLEVIKTGIQPEFRVLQNVPVQEKILETFKQLLPIQEQPTVLLNQLINNLAIINKNENISDTLKRLAKEILDSLPITTPPPQPSDSYDPVPFGKSPFDLLPTARQQLLPLYSVVLLPLCYLH